MGEKIMTALTFGVGAMTAIVILTSPRFRGSVSSLGGVYLGALRELRLAGK
jgi:hypothetical protein